MYAATAHSFQIIENYAHLDLLKFYSVEKGHYYLFQEELIPVEIYATGLLTTLYSL